MFIVLGIIEVSLENRRDLLETRGPYVAASQAATGNLALRIVQDYDHPDSFYIFEKWENKHARNRHTREPHTQAFRQALAQMQVL